MFSKLIPNSVAAGNGPRGRQGSPDAKKAAIAALPPTFRSGENEQAFRPGGRVEASDRTYLVGRDGELRRRRSDPAQRQINEAQKRMKQRIEEHLDRQDSARARKRAARALAKAKRTQERMEHLRQQLNDFRWVK